MVRRTVLTLIVAGVAVIVLATAIACGGGGSSSASPQASASGGLQKKYTFAYISQDPFDPYWYTLNRGAQDKAKELGVEVIFQTPADATVPSQTQALQSVMARKPDGIMISVVDSKGMIGPLQQAKDMGIPIVALDGAIADPSLALVTITSDNVRNGVYAAERMNELVGGKGEVGFVGYPPGYKSCDDRLVGWTEGLKKFPNLTDVGAQFDEGTINGAVKKTNALLARYPNLTGIFADWTNAVIGVATAVENAGKADQVSIVGYDGAPSEVELLKRGIVDVLIVQRVYTMGQLGVQYMVDYLETGKTPDQTILTLDSVIVTKDNVNDPAITPYLYDPGKN
jgi:ribose transport system substrate-binding protein